MSVNQYKNGKLNLVAGASNAPDVLDSYEEIQANTAPNKIAGALGVKELLGGLRFGVDGDGNYGYYGADGSLIPFSSGGGDITIKFTGRYWAGNGTNGTMSSGSEEYHIYVSSDGTVSTDFSEMSYYRSSATPGWTRFYIENLSVE